ncbi:MAG: hypothetical protein ACT4RN_17835 [Pseudonocardia sp.]
MTQPDSFRAQLATRLAALRAEHELCTDLLAQLDAEAHELRERLLRVEGAVALCEELLLTDTE